MAHAKFSAAPGCAGAPRILFIGPLPEPLTGHSLACQILLEHLRSMHVVTVINLSKGGLRNGFTSLGRVAEVLRILVEVWQRRRAADVIYLTVSESLVGNIKDVLIYWICRRQLPRMVIHLHGGSIRKDVFERYRWLTAMNRFFLRRVGAAILLGPSHRPIFDGIVPAARTHIVPNFAQDFLFCSDAEIAAKFRELQPVRVLFLSNLIAGKGYLELVDAYDMLAADQRATLAIDFAGAFESEAERAAFLVRIATYPLLQYHGVVGGAEKRRLLARAHVFCLPTRLNEGQPISILEAYAAGCAVITTTCGGIPDIFQDRTNGLVVEPEAAESLRAALTDCITRPEMLLPIAAGNADTARAHYRTPLYTERATAVLTGVWREAAA